MKSFHFGRNLRHCRQSQEYSQEYMAQLMGVSQSTYSRWEQSATPSLRQEQLEMLSVSLDVSVEQLLGSAIRIREINVDRVETPSAEETTSTEESQSETKGSFFSFFSNQQAWVQKVFFIGAVLLISYACFEFFKGLMSALK